MKKKITLILVLALCLVMIFAVNVFATATTSPSGQDTNTPNVENNIPNTEGPEENNSGNDGNNDGEMPQMSFQIRGESLGETVPIMCTGMLGIFIVTGIIIAIVLILNTTMTVIDNKKQNKENK
ncbi:MAG: hypothetical protein IJW54_05550 [Clostridia bacterium]|nr:hypothetical protein [Clostridia bacterium]